MEPLTLLTALVGPVSLDRLVSALRGEPQGNQLAADFLKALAASEDRLHLRLAGIESRLDHIIAQSYTEPLGLGIRLLADAANIAPPRRRAEIRSARRLFLKAAAATTSPLEVAVAERYALICALALDDDAGYARAAFDKLRHAAFAASMQAAETFRRSHELACERKGAPPQPESGESTRQRMARVEQEALVAREETTIRTAATEIAELAVAALREANAFNVYFGHPEPPDIVKLANDDPATAHLTGRGHSEFGPGLWLVTSPNDADVVQIGDLGISWNDVARVAAPGDRRMRVDRSRETFPGLSRWLDARWPRYMPVPRDYLLVGATMPPLADITLPIRARLRTNGKEIPIPPDQPKVSARWGKSVAELASDDKWQDLRSAFAPGRRPQSRPLSVHLVIHDTFVLGAPMPPPVD